MDADKLKRRLEHVRARIEEALARAGRPSGSCRLLAVTKGRPAQEVEALLALGQLELGENRVQEAATKIPMVKGPARWHMIGHLQRNKAKKALELFEVIHSVDSLRLLEELGSVASRLGRSPEVMLEVNISGEATKHGFAPEEVATACARANELPNLRLVGLMTMAPIVQDPEQARPIFRALRELRDRLNDAGATRCPLVELSMGMSQDYEVAIEEGATWVRVGSALFAEGET